MSDKPVTPLPDYERPPVIEVVFGIQFKRLENFRAPLFGLFWHRIREDYPITEEMPPLAAVVERFDSQQGSGPIKVEMEVLTAPPLPRIFFIDKTGNWVMQLQNDRFLHNWRKVNDGDVYPHYPHVSERFSKAWQSFLSFCAEEELPQPEINQLELTYINHIPSGDGWNDLVDINAIFPDLKWRATHGFLPNPESMTWALTFLLPNQQGRLRVSLRHAFHQVDMRPVLLCELTARGMSPTSELSSIKEWFALSREWIVRGFADLTGDRVQKEIWGRKV